MIYKPTGLNPSNQTFDITQDLPLFLKCKLDTANIKVDGYTIKVYDSDGNIVFSSVPEGQPLEIGQISLVSEVKTFIHTNYSTYEDSDPLVNTGLNGSILQVPFIVDQQPGTVPNTVAYNTLYYNGGNQYLYIPHPGQGTSTTIIMSNGNEYTWQITLYQLEYSSGIWKLPQNPLSIDIVITNGVVLGSTNERIQSVLTQEIYNDYWIQPTKIEGFEYDPEEPEKWKFTPVNQKISIRNIGSRTAIKNYDYSFGYIYPNLSGSPWADNVITSSNANTFRIYKQSNRPDDLTAYQKVSWVSNNPTDIKMVNGVVDPDNYNFDDEDIPGMLLYFTDALQPNNVIYQVYMDGAIKNKRQLPYYQNASWRRINSESNVGNSREELTWMSPQGEHDTGATPPGWGHVVSNNERIVLNHQDVDATLSSGTYAGNKYNGIYYPQIVKKSEDNYYIYTISWERTPDADTWGELSTKVVYVETPGSQFYGTNVNIKGYNNAETPAGSLNETPVLFVQEEPIDIYKYSTVGLEYDKADYINNTGVIFYNQPLGVPKWDPNRTYNQYEAVYNNDNVWISEIDNNTNKPTENEWWHLYYEETIPEGSSASFYDKDMMVWNDGHLYQSLIDDNGSNYWEWAPNTIYHVGDKVFLDPTNINDDPIFICTETHTSNSYFDVQYWDPQVNTYWRYIFDAPLYSSATTYNVGSLVYKTNDHVYISLQHNNTNHDPSTSLTPSNWHMVSTTESGLAVGDFIYRHNMLQQKTYIGGDDIANVYNGVGMLYIRPSLDAKPGMILGYQDDTYYYYIIINKVINKDSVCVLYDNLYKYNINEPYSLGTNPITPTTLTNGSVINVITIRDTDWISDETHYQIKSFFKDSDLAIFDTYSKPTVVITATHTGRGLICSATYAQAQYVSWKSAQWFLFDSLNNLVDKSGILYDGELAYTFKYVLNGTYTVGLIIETYSGYRIETTQSVTINDNVQSSVSELTLEMDCRRNAIKATIPGSSQMTSFILLKNQLYYYDNTHSGETKYQFVNDYSGAISHDIVIYDYNISNNRYYQYLVAGCLSNGLVDSKANIKTHWDSYYISNLYEVEGSNGKAYTTSLKDTWKFKFNMQSGEFSQGLSKSAQDTLGRFPKFINGPKNNITSQVTCLMGRDIEPMDLEPYGYSYVYNTQSGTWGWVQDTEPSRPSPAYQEHLWDGVNYPGQTNNRQADMLNAWREFCYSQNPKLLKDESGNAYIVQIHDASQKMEESWTGRPVSVTFSWTEIKDASGCQIYEIGE